MHPRFSYHEANFLSSGPEQSNFILLHIPYWRNLGYQYWPRIDRGCECQIWLSWPSGWWRPPSSSSLGFQIKLAFLQYIVWIQEDPIFPSSGFSGLCFLDIFCSNIRICKIKCVREHSRRLFLRNMRCSVIKKDLVYPPTHWRIIFYNLWSLH